MRAPIALGGGSRMNGMPAPRVTASQMMRIHAPKMTGMSSLSTVSPARETERIDDSTVTQRQASSQAAASEQEVGRERCSLEAGDVAQKQPGGKMRGDEKERGLGQSRQAEQRNQGRQAEKRRR